MDLVSIILPVYNSEKYLNKCIDSIIAQTYIDWELIVINDGSVDNSKDIINEYQKKDKRIKAFHFDNRGVSTSRNYGISVSSGEYITFIDSDDYVEPDYLKELLNSIYENDSDLSVCDVIEEYKGNRHIIKSLDTINNSIFLVDSQKVLDDILYHKIKNGYCCAKLFKKSKIKHLFQLYSYCEDVLFLVYYLAENEINVSYVHKPLYIYYKNDNSVTMKKESYKIKDMLNVSERIISDSLEHNRIKTKAAHALLIDYSFYILLFSIKNEELSSLYNLCKSNIKRHRKSVLLDKESSFKTKTACLLSYFPDKLLYFVYNHQPRKSL